MNLYNTYKFSNNKWSMIDGIYLSLKEALANFEGSIMQIEVKDNEYKVWVDNSYDVELYKVSVF